MSVESLTLHRELQLHFAERWQGRVGGLPMFWWSVCICHGDVFGGKILQHHLKHVHADDHLTCTRQRARSLRGRRWNVFQKKQQSSVNITDLLLTLMSFTTWSRLPHPDWSLKELWRLKWSDISRCLRPDHEPEDETLKNSSEAPCIKNQFNIQIIE